MVWGKWGVYFLDVVCGEFLGGIDFVERMRSIQYGYPIFGGKGVYNSFYIKTHVDILT